MKNKPVIKPRPPSLAELARRRREDHESNKLHHQDKEEALLKALRAAHYYIDASDQELTDDGLTRDQALTQARNLREAVDPTFE